MLDILLQFALGFGIALTGALIPGPLLMFVISHTLKSGRGLSGLLAGLGHCVVEFFLILLIIFGLAAFFNFSVFQNIVNVVGGVALIVFGVLNVLAVRGRQVIADSGSRIFSNSLMGGIFFTVFNATIPLWWATTGLFMLNRALMTTTIFGVVFWVLGHWSADLAWYTFVGYSVSKERNYMSERIYQVVMLICGVVLFSLGGFFLVSSLIRL